MVAKYSNNKRVMITEAEGVKNNIDSGLSREKIQSELKKSISSVTAKSINSTVSPNMVPATNLADNTISITDTITQSNNFVIYKSIPITIKPDNPTTKHDTPQKIFYPAKVTSLKPKNSSLSKNNPVDISLQKNIAPQAPINRSGIGKLFYASSMLQLDSSKKLK